MIAIDGTKVHANASERATRDYEQIAREILAEADAVDREEDERFGERRGDELPEQLATGEGRARWLAEAKRRLEQPAGRGGAGRSRPRAGNGCGNPSAAWRRSSRPSAARMRPMRPTGRAGVMRNGRRLGAHSPPKPYTPPATPPGKINTTDPDSRNVKTPRGWLQGYNAQAAANERQIVIAAELTNSSADFGQIEPMVNAARRELRAAGVTEVPEVVLADAGYWHRVQMQALAGDGIAVLIPPDANKRKGARPGWDGGLYAFMRRVLATPAGAELYRKRTAMIEPVFGHTKFNRKIDRFQRRDRAACRSEWRLITATHNLLKLHKHTTTPRRPDGRHAASERSPTHQALADRPALPRKRPQRRDLSATATMDRDSLPVAAAFHGCRSARPPIGRGRAPARRPSQA